MISFNILLIFFVFSFLHNGDSIRCFQCHDDSIDCENPYKEDRKFRGDLVVECSNENMLDMGILSPTRRPFPPLSVSNNTDMVVRADQNFEGDSQRKAPLFAYCIKFTYTLRGKVVNFRGCLTKKDGDGKPCSEVEYRVGERNETLLTCEQCRSNYCNSASKHNQIAALLTLLHLILLIN